MLSSNAFLQLFHFTGTNPLDMQGKISDFCFRNILMIDLAQLLTDFLRRFVGLGKLIRYIIANIHLQLLIRLQPQHQKLHMIHQTGIRHGIGID